MLLVLRGFEDRMSGLGTSFGDVSVLESALDCAANRCGGVKTVFFVNYTFITIV